MKLDLPDGLERPFLEYWAENLLDARDPQNARWLDLELGQIARAHTMTREIAEYAQLVGSRVLDIGCQTGALPIALALAGATVVGVDVDEKLVAGAAIRAECHRAAASFRVARAERLPFESASFDLVTFVDVIEHVEDAERAILEAARVLKPGGVMYLQGPNRYSPRWFMRDPHYRMFGISVLPPTLGRFYVTRVRRRPRYDVGVFPVGSRVVRWLESAGTELVRSPYDPSAALPTRIAGAVALRFASMFVIVARRAAV